MIVDLELLVKLRAQGVRTISFNEKGSVDHVTFFKIISPVIPELTGTTPVAEESKKADIFDILADGIIPGSPSATGYPSE